jgi:hypothetical protein
MGGHLPSKNISFHIGKVSYDAKVVKQAEKNSAKTINSIGNDVQKLAQYTASGLNLLKS